MKRMQGKVQTAVIAALGVKPMTTGELAAQVYVKPTAKPLSQIVSVLRVLTQLRKAGLVRESLVFNRDGVPCWVLDKAQIREDPKPRLRSV
jgi:hypothetical protein